MTSLALLAAVLLQGEPAAPVKLSIEASAKVFRPGHPMPLRITLENVSDATARLDEPGDFLEGLEIHGPDGRVHKTVGKTKGITKRSVTVDSRGFLGRTVDISTALEVPKEREGRYRLRWSFGDARSNEIKILVMRDWIATLDTNHGKIAIEFYPDSAPKHVERFLHLARSGFYKGSIFHRVIPGFMMQGGAPLRPADALKKPLKAEFSDRKHLFGTVSMARTSDPDSALSQFFICFGEVSHLDRG